MTPVWTERSNAGKNESRRSHSSSPPQGSCGSEEMTRSAQRFEFHDKPGELRRGGVGSCHEHEIPACIHLPLQAPKSLAQAPFRTVSPYRSSHTAACRHRHSPGFPGRPEVENESITDVATAFPINTRKVRPARDPVTPSYDGARRRLARNRLRRSTFRPPGVRIRMRNPCVLLRCLRFG